MEVPVLAPVVNDMSPLHQLTPVLVFVCLTALPPICRASQPDVDGQPDFNRDIRPILAARCFPCHGPDESHREADLRLDDREGAVDSGAITPGEPDLSELLARVRSADPDERMPPPDEEPLSEEQVRLLTEWVRGGAEYAQHWSFVPPVRPTVPSSNEEWTRNEIDHFVLAALRERGLKHLEEADRHTLIRRLYLDLIGLPPTPDEVEAFLKDSEEGAYERLVDRLLRSDHYGEHWARQWLDLARYADTNGYEKDRDRSVWPYRDWVIRALNADLPFDQFTIEQLAGDMLPGATLDQRVATGFHRNTMLNEEGGIDPLEYRFYAMVDRVATTGTVWLGMTIGCAQCHSHKYDPVSHTEYYRFMALLDNADEPDLLLKTPEVLASRSAAMQEIEQMELELPAKFPPLEGDGPEEKRRIQNFAASFEEWLKELRQRVANWTPLRPTKWETNLPRLEVLADDSLFSTGDITKRDEFQLTFQLSEDVLPVTALRLEVLPDERLPAGGPGRAYYEGRKGDFFLSELRATFDQAEVQLVSASHSYGKIAVGSGSAAANNVLDGDGSTGWSTAQREGERHQLVVNLAKPIEVAGVLRLEMLFERHFAASLGRFRISAANGNDKLEATDLPGDLEQLLVAPGDIRSEGREALRRHFARVAPELAEARQELTKRRRSMPSFPTAMVMQERHIDNPRPTRRRHRGEYLSPREEVSPGVPEVLVGSEERQPANRLEFAKWLASRDNPLVARVTVNRAWRSFFGSGLLRTSGDFGTQANTPTHPELLDWLAIEFVDRGWSLKQLHRLIVTSATYRQSSRVTAESLSTDPDNSWLARGPRHRLGAETIRDTMLRASGLLSTKMYGPSVFPPQPASVAALAYGGQRWTPSKGEDRFRRSLYTYSKRTAPFAAYTVFDGPTGESCIARRNRSNTPLQALTLLNDAMFVEMAGALAKTAMSAGGSQESIATTIFRRLLTREPDSEELAAILAYRQTQQKRLQGGELKASEVATDPQADGELAAWTMVARALMNVDEAITKQ